MQRNISSTPENNAAPNLAGVEWGVPCTTRTRPLGLSVPLATKNSRRISKQRCCSEFWQVSVWGFQPDGMREVERPGCRADASCEKMHLTRLGRVLSGALCVQLVDRTETSRPGESLMLVVGSGFA